jgi:hypothetical protein
MRRKGTKKIQLSKQALTNLQVTALNYATEAPCFAEMPPIGGTLIFSK